MRLVLIFRLSFILLQDEQSGTRRTRLLRILRMSKKFAQMSKCALGARHQREAAENSARKQEAVSFSKEWPLNVRHLTPTLFPFEAESEKLIERASGI